MNKELTKQQIITDAIEEVVGVTIDEMRSANRKLNFVYARMIYARFRYSGIVSMSKVGKEINRDNATVWHYLNRYDVEIQSSPRFRYFHDGISQLLNLWEDEK